ncbi:hypothetical protein JNUCC0626_37900 [Lentzea sp. JNUCC 0626]|uniref:hypothetical protein n=1 Tax=Lentzea sp. JNUCC 0626 TaxID=3367513 RepID=UPI00374A131A
MRCSSTESRRETSNNPPSSPAATAAIVCRTKAVWVPLQHNVSHVPSDSVSALPTGSANASRLLGHDVQRRLFGAAQGTHAQHLAWTKSEVTVEGAPK